MKDNDFQIGSARLPARKPAPGLYVVSTPIGNLRDITLRALEVLASADIIACEDTRTTAKLLNRYAISRERIAYNEHNADSIGPRLLERVVRGEVVALVSDAGTPLVSDPGQRLVAAAKQQQLAVFPIPGASAPLAALAASGLPTELFTFAGFIPSRQGERQDFLEQFRDSPATLVFFESPNRLAATLAVLAGIMGTARKACIARELTKLHEETRLAALGDLAVHYSENPPKGEIVIVLAPAAAGGGELDVDALLLDLLKDNSLSRAAAEAATLSGRSKRDLYQRALELSRETNAPDGDAPDRDDGR